jgi:hypothetical protein
MIIVSGEPRSGTTMMMEIVQELGYSIQYDQDNNAASQCLELNSMIALNGLSMDMYLGKLPHLCPRITADCVKLLTSAITSTHLDLVDKVIYMMRNLNDTIKSQSEHGYLGDLPAQYAANIKLFMQWAFENKIDVLVVDYDSVVQSPLWEVTRVAVFLGDPSSELTTKAAMIVKTKGE